MLFNSIGFAFFLPVVFILYWFVFSRNLKWQHLLLAVASFFFYACWDWRFLFLLVFSTSVDFVVAYYLDKVEDIRQRKMLVAVTLVSNLGLLRFFKYYNFFTGSLLALFPGLNAHTLQIVLPIGISFYTFQSIAYVIDVYRKEIKACKDYITFMAFVSFLPQLVAGPISRAKNLLTQFYQPKVFDKELAVSGLRFILWGLFKKVVIADNLVRLVDAVYGSSGEYNGITSTVATVFFALQIYCDFSGYSDIAVGTARLLGFNLVQNFRTPYFSTSLRQFWQRWHISLSTWFRDYVYIPLGGNKVSEPRKYFNLFITFLISGLWHGANFTFVVWGALHGLVLIAEEFVKGRLNITLPAFVKQVLTFAIVCLAWIFFRANSIQDAYSITASLGHGWDIGLLSKLIEEVYFSWTFFTALIITVVGFLMLELKPLQTEIGPFAFLPSRMRWPVYYLFIILITFLGLHDNAPNFIYFKF